MNELDIIKKIQSWDNSLFWELYDLYVDKIYNFIYLKTYDSWIAEDLTSETFFKALEKIDSFRSIDWAWFSSWIYRIAYNKVIDHYKAKKEELSLDNIFDLWEENNFWKSIDDKDKIKEVFEFINWLNREHKEIIIMRLWDNLSYKEIAEITGKNVDNCKKIFSRNMKKINENITLVLLILLFI